MTVPGRVVIHYRVARHILKGLLRAKYHNSKNTLLPGRIRVLVESPSAFSDSPFYLDGVRTWSQSFSPVNDYSHACSSLVNVWSNLSFRNTIYDKAKQYLITYRR
jgi:hypothetical protein